MECLWQLSFSMNNTIYRMLSILWTAVLTSLYNLYMYMYQWHNELFKSDGTCKSLLSDCYWQCLLLKKKLLLFRSLLLCPTHKSFYWFLHVIILICILSAYKIYETIHLLPIRNCNLLTLYISRDFSTNACRLNERKIPNECSIHV